MVTDLGKARCGGGGRCAAPALVPPPPAEQRSNSFRREPRAPPDRVEVGRGGPGKCREQISGT